MLKKLYINIVYHVCKNMSNYKKIISDYVRIATSAARCTSY